MLLRDEVRACADRFEQRCLVWGSRGSMCGVRLSYPTMSQSQEPAPRRRSAFAAAFLSLIFPGLGHAYAGAYTRALGFAAAPDPPRRAQRRRSACGRTSTSCSASPSSTSASSRSSTSSCCCYRIVAAVDAYRVAGYLNALDTGGGRLGRPRRAIDPISVAGLAAVILVMSGVHVAVALLRHAGPEPRRLRLRPDRDGPVRRTGAVGEPGTDRPTASTRATAPARRPTSARRRPGATAAPAETVKPWTGGRLNILLIGADQRPKQSVFNTDTLIVASLDPKTNQVAMFSLPRDTIQVPLPPGPAQNRLRVRLPVQDQRPLGAGPAPAGPLPRQRQAARLPGPQGHPRQPLRARHPVLRGGQLRRLPEGRRRGRRGHDQRPDPRPRRPVPGRRRAGPSHLHPRRAAAHDRRPGARVRPVAPRLERLRPAQRASSACSSRSRTRST